MKRLAYLAAPDTGVWDYSIQALEAGLDRVGMQRTRGIGTRLPALAAKVVAKTRLGRNLRQQPGRARFVTMMGPAEYRLVPFGFIDEAVPYVYDCWPAAYERWESMLHRYRIRLAFFSARGSAEHFRERIPELEALWMPEATDPRDYDPGGPLRDRSIDVLELGRRNPAFHGGVTQALDAAGRTHSYEAQPGRIIFPDRASLVRGLADSRISICFPSSVTHPARSGTLETVTHRYFESMAARCLVVGHCPAELADLFGYHPVLEVDRDRPASQLLELLSDIDAHQELVERNFERLLEVGTWDIRVREMIEALTERGYSL